GFFALGQPHQFVPPPSGWTVVVPPIPPPVVPPKPGEKPKPAAPRPFRPLFYDNDFRYLDKPDNKVIDPFDFLKRIPITPDGKVKVDIGGEFRWQSKREDNRRLDGRENNYNLFRERLYVDAWFADRFRVYFETIWSDSSRQTQPPADRHQPRRLAQRLRRTAPVLGRRADASARYGRQELLGNQRLVSPGLGQHSTHVRRRARLVYRSKGWDIDGFWGRPVVPAAREFDHGDQSRQFFGPTASTRGLPTTPSISITSA
ncbi:MAG: alginate export family protein, partial [Singulisphaera sp.]